MMQTAAMVSLGGVPFGTPFQGLTLAAVVVIGVGLAIRAWIIGMPDRKRADNEAAVINNTEAATRFKEFRVEVHGLRNELATVRAELHKATNQSARRGDKLNMLLFILRLVMDELASKEPGNKVLAQARSLLHRVDDEPPVSEQSSTLQAAENTVEQAQETVREVKAAEANGGK